MRAVAQARANSADASARRRHAMMVSGRLTVLNGGMNKPKDVQGLTARGRDLTKLEESLGGIP